MSIRPLHFGLRPKEVQDSRALYLRPQLKAHPHPSFAKTPIRHGRERGPRPRSEQRRSRPHNAMPASDSKSLIPVSTRVSSHATLSSLARFLRACGVALRSHLGLRPKLVGAVLSWLHSGECEASEDELVHADEPENAGGPAYGRSEYGRLPRRNTHARKSF